MLTKYDIIEALIRGPCPVVYSHSLLSHSSTRARTACVLQVRGKKARDWCKTKRGKISYTPQSSVPPSIVVVLNYFLKCFNSIELPQWNTKRPGSNISMQQYRSAVDEVKRFDNVSIVVIRISLFLCLVIPRTGNSKSTSRAWKRAPAVVASGNWKM